MSDPIRGRGPNTPPDLNQPAAPDVAPKSTGTAATPPQAGAADAAVVDKFERSAKVGAQLETRLQALAGKGVPAKIQFSNEDIAFLASAFASVLAQNPGANRLKRSRLFAKAILKRKRLRKAFAGIPEAQMEQMCDIIGDVLDSSPVFGQLVDNVTEGASKLNAG